MSLIETVSRLNTFHSYLYTDYLLINTKVLIPKHKTDAQTDANTKTQLIELSFLFHLNMNAFCIRTAPNEK